MISIVIPSRREKFLIPTINDLLKNARGDIEIIPVLDECGDAVDKISDDPRVKPIYSSGASGMRKCINMAVEKAQGEYIMKIDGHCMVGEGYDTILAADCEDNWVVVPRRKRLDAENWGVQDVGKPDIDYMYLAYPDDPTDFGGKGLNGKLWEEKNRDVSLRSKEIDDLMSEQGSMWFMKKKYFHELELMDEKNYGTFWNEFQEIGLKCWLSGGRVVKNKKTWYAHLHKGKKYGRGYNLDHAQLTIGATHTNKWFNFKEAWDKQTLPLSWLIEKFWPVPTWDDAKLAKLKEHERTQLHTR